jgi:hypothetical protein
MGRDKDEVKADFLSPAMHPRLGNVSDQTDHKEQDFMEMGQVKER